MGALTSISKLADDKKFSEKNFLSTGYIVGAFRYAALNNKVTG